MADELWIDKGFDTIVEVIASTLFYEFRQDEDTPMSDYEVEGNTITLKFPSRDIKLTVWNPDARPS